MQIFRSGPISIFTCILSCEKSRIVYSGNKTQCLCVLCGAKPPIHNYNGIANKQELGTIRLSGPHLPTLLTDKTHELIVIYSENKTFNNSNFKRCYIHQLYRPDRSVLAYIDGCIQKSETILIINIATEMSCIKY